MPTIPQLPGAITGAATDPILVYQGDNQTHSVSPGALAVLPTGSSATI